MHRAGYYDQGETSGIERALTTAEVIVNDMGAQAVLIKGGHLRSGDRVVDILYDGDVRAFRGKRLNTTSTHGTGCTLSAAIAIKWLVAFLARHGLVVFGWYRLILCAVIATLIAMELVSIAP